MNVNHIIELIEISKTNSINKAASNLKMFPQNLSKHIKYLETEIGEKLIQTTTGGTLLTNFSLEHLNDFCEIVRLYHSIMNKSNKNKIILATDHNGYYNSIFNLSKLCSDFLEVDYSYSPFTISDAIDNRKADLFLSQKTNMFDSLNYTNLFYDQVYICYSKDIDSFDLSMLSSSYELAFLFKLDKYNNCILNYFSNLNINVTFYDNNLSLLINNATNKKTCFLIYGFFLDIVKQNFNCFKVDSLSIPFGVYYKEPSLLIDKFIDVATEYFENYQF